MKKLTAIAILVLVSLPVFAQSSIGGGLFGGPARTVRYGTSDPAACATSRDNIFFRTDLGQLKLCTATNTWSGILTSGSTGLFADGTEAAPSITFTSDPDTGIFRFGANAIGFTVAGADAWVINASGTLLPASDAGADIGNGSSDPRDINFTRYLLPNGTAFASLGTPANGAITYCTDCTQASPCAGGGTGAMAKREASAWNCGGGGGTLTSQTLTAGDLTAASNAVRAVTVSTFTYTGLQVQALPGTSGNLTVATLPAKTVVLNVYLLVGVRDDSGQTLTGSVGRVGASYIDYVVASDLTTGASAGTIYGNASGERGTNNTGYDFASQGSTTAVVIQFVSNGDLANIEAGISGTVVIEHYTIP